MTQTANGGQPLTKHEKDYRRPSCVTSGGSGPTLRRQMTIGRHQGLAGVDTRKFTAPIRQTLAGIAAPSHRGGKRARSHTAWVKTSRQNMSAVAAAFPESRPGGLAPKIGRVL
jgi:hypothetical protein